MLKVAISIVTYNNERDINNNIKSLLDSSAWRNNLCRLDIEVINNHSNFYLRYPIEVIHNKLRPNWSTGHLSRDYNSALIRKFKNLNDPINDIVITVQDDILWEYNWFEQLLDIMNRGYTFVTSGPGDSFVAVTADAIKKIGIWDERFCAIGYHEADMFLRAIIWNGNKSSINDPEHVREWNRMDHGLRDTPGYRYQSDLITVPYWNAARREEADRSRPVGAPMYNYDIVDRLFNKKWGGINNHSWNGVTFPTGPCIDTPYFYPYFERDISDLATKRYV